MEKLVFFPTNNIGKYDRYKKSFENKKINYNRYLKDKNGKDIKVDIIEDGKSTKENANKKAKAYYDEYKKYINNNNFSVITTDEALYIDGLEKNKQPGLFVRRFNGLKSERATDNEVLERYTKFIKKLGGEVGAIWIYSLVMYDGSRFYDYSWKEKVLFSDTPHFPITRGYVLNNITVVKKNNGNNIMLSDLTQEERYEYLSKYTDTVANFINDKIINKIG